MKFVTRGVALLCCIHLIPNMSKAQLYSASKVLAVGTIASATSVGDYDKDGDDDLLVSGSESDGPAPLRLFEIQNGEITEKSGHGLPQEATQAEWIDFDGDNDLDAFVANAGHVGCKADFYINNGGLFTPMKLVLPNLRYSRFSIVDYDSDGDIDIFMSGFEGTSPMKFLLITNEINSFTIENTNLQWLQAGRCAWADFDNDKDLDVLISGSNSSTLYRNENGSFSEFKSNFPGGSSGQVRWSDFDDDDDLDLLITGSTTAGNTAKIFKNNGDKTFTEFGGINLKGTDEGDSQWIDFDKDGDLDLFHSGIADGSYLSELYEWNNGTYTFVSSLGLPQRGNFCFVDFDNDEDFDVFMPNDKLTSRIYRNNLKANPYPLDPTPAWPSQLNAHPIDGSQIELQWYDYADNETSYTIEMKTGTNGNFVLIKFMPTNSTKVTVTGLAAETEYTFRVRAGNSFGQSRYSEEVMSMTASPDLIKLPSIPSVRSTSSAWADMDDDGDLDLIYSGQGTSVESFAPKTFILKNDAGSFVTQSHNLPVLTAYDLDWADYDHDGDLDLLMSGMPTYNPSGTNTAKTKLLINEGNFVFTEDTQLLMKGVRSGFSKWIDVNGDGYMDIYLSGINDSNVEVLYSQLLINQKDGTFEEKIGSGLPTVYQGEMIHGDFNNDGRVDIAVTGLKDTLNGAVAIPACAVYANQGAGNFKLAQSLTPASDTSIKSGDFDQDGDTDLIVTGNVHSSNTETKRESTIFWNNEGKFTRDTKNKIPAVPYGKLVTGDIDNDGDVDILLGGHSSDGLIASVYSNDGTGLFVKAFYSLARFLYNNYSLGDYDQDGDIDVFESGSPLSSSEEKAIILKNQTSRINDKPAAPLIVRADGVAGGIILTFNRGNDDRTPKQSLTSNVYVKDSGGKYVYSREAEVTTGKLKLPFIGNTFLNDSIYIRDLAPGVYTVGVQTIDASYSASVFTTTTVTVEMTTPILLTQNPSACQNSNAEIEVLGYPVVWYSDAALTNRVGTGNVFKPYIDKSDLEFYAVEQIDDQKTIPLKVNVKVYLLEKIILSNDTLVAPAGVSYQWYRNDELLGGKTERKLPVTTSGRYVAKITSGFCVDYELVFVYQPVSIADEQSEDEIRLFQDLTGETLYIATGSRMVEVISIFDSAGRNLLRSVSHVDPYTEFIVNTDFLRAGLYIIHLQGTHSFRGKFVKK
jgi:hypothetical protein